jgi:endonuclease III
MADVILFLVNFSVVWNISFGQLIEGIEEVQRRNFSKLLTKRRDKMLQEFYRHDLLKFFLCCIALNRTRGETAREVMGKFFLEFPNPWKITQKELPRVRDVTYPLGFHTTKPKNMVDLCEEFRTNEVVHPNSRYIFTRAEIVGLPGLGKYAADCYDAIINNDLDLDHYVEPLDSRLKQYIEERRDKHETV